MDIVDEFIGDGREIREGPEDTRIDGQEDGSGPGVQASTDHVFRFQIKDDIEAARKRRRRRTLEVRRGADDEANKDSALIWNRK
jgi:hypothetical protein